MSLSTCVESQYSKRNFRFKNLANFLTMNVKSNNAPEKNVALILAKVAKYTRLNHRRVGIDPFHVASIIPRTTSTIKLTYALRILIDCFSASERVLS